MHNLHSRALQILVELLASWPGVGKRTAVRYALYLLGQSPDYLRILGEKIVQLKDNVKLCSCCGNFSDSSLCDICLSPSRKGLGIICVVEDIQALMAIENTGSFNGVYHVLGGLIMPTEGIGPEQLRITQLSERIQNDKINEIILALSSTPEGDTTAYYLHRRFSESQVKITTLSRGIGFGNELQYTDDVTLARSLQNRIIYNPNLSTT